MFTSKIKALWHKLRNTKERAIQQIKAIPKGPEELGGEGSVLPEHASVAGAIILFLSSLLVLTGAVWFSLAKISSENPAYLVQAAVQLALGSIIMGAMKYPIAVGFVWLMFQVVESSRMGQRIKSKDALFVGLAVIAGLIFGAVAK